MMSCYKLYLDPTEALMDQSIKNRLLSLMTILVWHGG